MVCKSFTLSCDKLARTPGSRVAVAKSRLLLQGEKTAGHRLDYSASIVKTSQIHDETGSISGQLKEDGFLWPLLEV